MSKSNSLISVIISNYNYGQYISDAITSVLNQTYKNFELIIVDDGSTDNSRDIIESFNDSRIKKIYQENGGQASAFNKGFTLANGRIISFLDSDDWWVPSKLQTVVKWTDFLNEKYSVLQHNLDIWDNGNVKIYKAILPTGNCFEEMKSTHNIDYFVPTSGLSFIKDVLSKVFPIPISLKISADAYLMRTSFIYGHVYSIPESLGYYRKHSNSVFSNKQFDKQKFFNEILFPNLNKFYSDNNIDYKLQVNNSFKNNKSYKEKLKMFLRSIRL